MEQISLRPDELKRIIEFADKFGGNDYVVITRDNPSGIGYTVEATIETTVEGVRGKFTVEIVGADKW